MSKESVYLTTENIFFNAQSNLISNIFDATKTVYDSLFFNSLVSLSLIAFGLFILKEGVTRDRVNRAISFLIMFAIIHTITWNKPLYKGFLEIMNMPQTIMMKASSIALGKNGFNANDVTGSLVSIFAETQNNINGNDITN